MFIFGYAAGALLQALGKALIEGPWRWVRGGQPTATLLMPDSKKLSASTKGDVLTAISAAYGESPLGDRDEGYRKLLEDRTYRAWKAVAPSDPQAHRFLAEVHAARAFAVAFFVLCVVTLVGAGIYGDEDMTLQIHGTLAVVYVLLLSISLWRMENKAVTFARHVLFNFAEKTTDE